MDVDERKIYAEFWNDVYFLALRRGERQIHRQGDLMSIFGAFSSRAANFLYNVALCSSAIVLSTKSHTLGTK